MSRCLPSLRPAPRLLLPLQEVGGPALLIPARYQLTTLPAASAAWAPVAPGRQVSRDSLRARSGDTGPHPPASYKLLPLLQPTPGWQGHSGPPSPAHHILTTSIVRIF